MPSSAASAAFAEMNRHAGSCAIAIGIGARAMIACSEQALSQLFGTQVVESVEGTPVKHGVSHSWVGAPLI
jgi:hypothetical protein